MRDWINIYVNERGTVGESDSLLNGRFVFATETIELSKTTSGGILGLFEDTHDTITILETDRSGAIYIEDTEGATAYGDAEVYLVIERGPREARFLSAPLHEPVKIKGATRVQLVILAEAGPSNATYYALVNAHCVFETKMDVEFESDPWKDALGWPGW